MKYDRIAKKKTDDELLAAVNNSRIRTKPINSSTRICSKNARTLARQPQIYRLKSKTKIISDAVLPHMQRNRRFGKDSL
jgi:dipeptidase